MLTFNLFNKMLLLRINQRGSREFWEPVHIRGIQISDGKTITKPVCCNILYFLKFSKKKKMIFIQIQSSTKHILYELLLQSVKQNFIVANQFLFLSIVDIIPQYVPIGRMLKSIYCVWYTAMYFIYTKNLK